MIIVNGQQQDLIPAQDRGVSYGDGLFETIAVVDGEPLLWSMHMDRLEDGCIRLNIAFPGRELLEAETRQLGGDDRFIVKVIVTRGSGGRGYAYPPDLAPNRIIMRSEWPDYPHDYQGSGIQTRLCEIRLARQPRLAGMKHLNRLEQVMARAEWDDADIAEGLMLDMNNNLIEGTMSNIFVVDQGKLLTPSLDECGVAGVQRRNVMKLAGESGIVVNECEIPVAELGNYSEVFVTNSIIGIWPVIAIDSLKYPIGQVTRMLQKSLGHPA